MSDDSLAKLIVEEYMKGVKEIIMKRKSVESFKIERLYFRYIKGTNFEGKITTESLAMFLYGLGFITFQDNGTRYRETRKFKKYRERNDFLANVPLYKLTEE